MHLSTDLEKLEYSSYMGTSADDGFRAVAIDAAGRIYATGKTDSTQWPVKDALQAANAGGIDVVLVRFDVSNP